MRCCGTPTAPPDGVDPQSLGLVHNHHRDLVAGTDTNHARQPVSDDKNRFLTSSAASSPQLLLSPLPLLSRHEGEGVAL